MPSKRQQRPDCVLFPNALHLVPENVEVNRSSLDRFLEIQLLAFFFSIQNFRFLQCTFIFTVLSKRFFQKNTTKTVFVYLTANSMTLYGEFMHDFVQRIARRCTANCKLTSGVLLSVLHRF